MKTKYERLRKTKEQMAHRRLAKKLLHKEVSDFFYSDYWPRPDEDDLQIDPAHHIYWDEYNDPYRPEWDIIDQDADFDSGWIDYTPFELDGQEFEDDSETYYPTY